MSAASRCACDTGVVLAVQAPPGPPSHLPRYTDPNSPLIAPSASTSAAVTYPRPDPTPQAGRHHPIADPTQRPPPAMHHVLQPPPHQRRSPRDTTQRHSRAFNHCRYYPRRSSGGMQPVRRRSTIAGFNATPTPPPRPALYRGSAAAGEVRAHTGICHLTEQVLDRRKPAVDTRHGPRGRGHLSGERSGGTRRIRSFAKRAISTDDRPTA